MKSLQENYSIWFYIPIHQIMSQSSDTCLAHHILTSWRLHKEKRYFDVDISRLTRLWPFDHLAVPFLHLSTLGYSLRPTIYNCHSGVAMIYPQQSVAYIVAIVGLRFLFALSVSYFCPANIASWPTNRKVDSRIDA